jgi:hypothetical protein
MSEEVDMIRRHFLGAAAMTIAAARFHDGVEAFSFTFG